jgi:hypothetical protein
MSQLLCFPFILHKAIGFHGFSSLVLQDKVEAGTGGGGERLGNK